MQCTTYYRTNTLSFTR